MRCGWLIAILVGSAAVAADSEAVVLERLRARVPPELRVPEPPADRDNAWSQWAMMALDAPADPEWTELASRALRNYAVGWSDAERATANAWIAQRSASLDAFIAGARAPACRLPVERVLTHDPQVYATRTAARLLMFRSALRCEQGDLPGAIADSRSLLAAGRLLTQADGPGTVWMMGVSLQHMGYSCLARCIHHRRCTAALLHGEIASAFAPPLHESLQRALRGEIWVLTLPHLAQLERRRLEAIAAGAPTTPALVDALYQIINSEAYAVPDHPVDPPAAAAIAAYSAAIEDIHVHRDFATLDLDATCSTLVALIDAIRPHADDRLGTDDARFRARADAIWTSAMGTELERAVLGARSSGDEAVYAAVAKQLDNHFGRTVIGLAGSAGRAMVPAAWAADANRALVLAAAALRDGASLTAPRAPWGGMTWGIDPFSGDALHADASRHVVWSVWKNGTDEGGKDAPYDNKGDDRVLSTALWGD